MSYSSDFRDVHCSTTSGATFTTPPSSVQFSTTISSVDSAALASPFANVATALTKSSPISTFLDPNPLGSSSARRSSPAKSSSPSPFSTNTLHRDSNAPLTSNDGFSVVAPIKMMLPFSTNGKNASCCALLNRWISSTNTIVFRPHAFSSSACRITSLISLMPLVTAENVMNRACVVFATTFASVVFPTPGGPQNTMLGTVSRSISVRRIFPGPIRCDCPTTSSNVLGRSRSASGALSSVPPGPIAVHRVGSGSCTPPTPVNLPWFAVMPPC